MAESMERCRCKGVFKSAGIRSPRHSLMSLIMVDTGNCEAFKKGNVTTRFMFTKIITEMLENGFRENERKILLSINKEMD